MLPPCWYYIFLVDYALINELYFIEYLIVMIDLSYYYAIEIFNALFGVMPVSIRPSYE